MHGTEERYRDETERNQERGAPRRADEQAAPEPERPTTPQEDAGQSIPELEEPPQAEGDA
jgi:hypothetical protein